MQKRIQTVLTDRRGMSTSVGVLVAILVLALVGACFMGVAEQLHRVTTLDRFADELAAKAGQQGRCSGLALEERYDELVRSTGVKPKVIYEADYYNPSTRLVQYGEPITVRLTLETKLVGFGSFYLPLTLRVSSTEQSMQYWK